MTELMVGTPYVPPVLHGEIKSDTVRCSTGLVGRSVGHRALIVQHYTAQRNTIAVEFIITRHYIHRITHNMS